MNIEIIKSKYPKAYDQIIKWLKHTMGTQALPAGADEFANAMINAALQNVTASRALYDFFDGYQILGYVYPIPGTGKSYWDFKINDEDFSNGFNSRKEAEQSLFDTMFEKLEKTMTNG